MVESEELVGFLTNKKLKGIKFRHNFAIISNVFLIAVIICIGVYVYINIEEFKALGQDVCRLCELKTGGLCLAHGVYNITTSPVVTNYTANLNKIFLNAS